MKFMGCAGAARESGGRPDMPPSESREAKMLPRATAESTA